MNTTHPKLSTPLSRRERALAALASVLITLAVVAGNLELARDHAHAGPGSADTAQARQTARG